MTHEVLVGGIPSALQDHASLKIEVHLLVVVGFFLESTYVSVVIVALNVTSFIQNEVNPFFFQRKRMMMMMRMRMRMRMKRKVFGR